MARFSPVDQQQLTLPVVEIYNAIETELLMNIAKLLAEDVPLLLQAEDGTDYQHWRLIQLGKVGQLTRVQIEAISRYSGKTAEEVANMLTKAGYGPLMAHEEIYTTAIAEGAALLVPPPISQSPQLMNVLYAYQEQATDMFNLINTTMLKQSQQIHRDIINRVVGMLLTGTITPQQALKRTAREWSQKGIPSLIDRAGKRWSTEAYVSMITRTLSQNVATEMQFTRMDEYGTDLIEVSSHMGARELCAPYQGKIFSRSGKSKLYPAWSTTSYGEAAGLLGINCGHAIYPYIHGKSTKRYEPYDEEENRRSYLESQQQRLLERTIRKQKRELMVMKQIGSEEGVQEATAKIKSTEAELREFLAKTGRARRRKREQIV